MIGATAYRRHARIGGPIGGGFAGVALAAATWLAIPSISQAGNVQRSPLWPDGRIEFTICEASIAGLDADRLKAKLTKRGCDTAGDDWADHLVSESGAALIRSAQSNWNRQFPKITLHESDEIDLKSHYVRFYLKGKEDPCSSLGIGFKSENTFHDIIVNDKRMRNNEYVLMHEIMHRVGIYHEHDCRSSCRLLQPAYGQAS